MGAADCFPRARQFAGVGRQTLSMGVTIVPPTRPVIASACGERRLTSSILGTYVGLGSGAGTGRESAAAGRRGGGPPPWGDGIGGPSSPLLLGRPEPGIKKSRRRKKPRGVCTKACRATNWTIRSLISRSRATCQRATRVKSAVSPSKNARCRRPRLSARRHRRSCFCQMACSSTRALRHFSSRYVRPFESARASQLRGTTWTWRRGHPSPGIAS